MTNSVTKQYDRKVLKDQSGRKVLESSLYSDSILFVYETGDHVKVEELEELLDVTIITKKDFQSAGNLVGPAGNKHFYFGGIEFNYEDNASDLRKKGLKYIKAANEIERKSNEAKAKAERIKAAEEETKKRREIAAIVEVLRNEGKVVGNVNGIATALYEAGVRKV